MAQGGTQLQNPWRPEVEFDCGPGNWSVVNRYLRSAKFQSNPLINSVSANQIVTSIRPSLCTRAHICILRIGFGTVSLTYTELLMERLLESFWGYVWNGFHHETSLLTSIRTLPPCRVKCVLLPVLFLLRFWENNVHSWVALIAPSQWIPEIVRSFQQLFRKMLDVVEESW